MRKKDDATLVYAIAEALGIEPLEVVDVIYLGPRTLDVLRVQLFHLEQKKL